MRKLPVRKQIQAVFDLILPANGVAKLPFSQSWINVQCKYNLTIRKEDFFKVSLLTHNPLLRQPTNITALPRTQYQSSFTVKKTKTKKQTDRHGG